MSTPIYSDHPIVGTWRLTSFTEQNLETETVSYPFGKRGERSSSTQLMGTSRRSSRRRIASRLSQHRRLNRRRSIFIAA